jgi:hypothetical protein
MSHSFPVRRDGAHPRWRGAVTTTLMLLLAVLIVRDFFARRWGTTPPPSADVTRLIP